MAQEPLPKNPQEVVSRAAVLLGLDPITSFSELDRAEVVVASQIYEVIVADVTAAYPWRHCTGQQVLEVDPSPPLDRYETAYHLPVMEEGQPFTIERISANTTEGIRYDINGGRLFCDVDPGEELVATYQYRVAEAFWPPGFMLLVIMRIAEALAGSVTRNPAQIKSMGEMSEMQFRRAKTRDSQSVTTKVMRMTRFERVRRSRGGFTS
jgi:hypothetical protein